jgi:Mrp family chromosome partitioning ATPase
MEALIREMKVKYSRERILIFDCSSFLSNADPMVLSRYVDAVLLIVESAKTETKSLLRMKELLKDTKIIGTVINKFGTANNPKCVYKDFLNFSTSRIQDILRDLGLQNFQTNILWPRFSRRKAR